MNIPIYDAVLNSMEDGVYAVSLVEFPAVERDFIAFSKDEKKDFKFEIEDEKEHRITGVIMLADTPIYRYSLETGEYYIRFSKDVIKEMAEGMLMYNRANTIDLQHDENYFFGKANICELWIKDSEKGMNHMAFSDVPDGSLMATYKVHDVDLWDKIEKGEVKGFSIEAWMNFRESFENKKEDKNNTLLMNIKELFKKLLTKLGKFVAIDGTEIYYDGEEIEIGIEVLDAEGSPIADGEYEAEDKIIVVADGKVSEIRIKEEEKPEETVEEVEVEAEEPEVEEEVVVEPEEEPAPEDKSDMEKEVEDLKREIEDMKKQIEEILSILQKPVVEPIIEEFEKAVEPAKGGKFTKAAAILSSLK